MHLSSSLLICGLLGLVGGGHCAPTPVEERTVPSSTVSNNVIFSPPSNANWTDPRVLYSRVIELSDGSLLATWENYSPEPPLVYFPIYKSLDGGVTWSEISKVEDQVNDWGLRYQPFLYELPQAIGDYAAGTILLAGNSIPTDLSQTKIDVYASTDGGETWEFVSSVASGGEARPTNGLTPVWEPYLMVYNDELICYYSDQRDSNYGQKLVHQTTSDLLTWSDLVDDVHDDSNYAARPGMPGLALLPNGEYIFTYEACGTDGCRLHYRLTSDPLNVLEAASYSLVSTAGTRPVSSPYVVWSSVGGENGSIIVSGGSTSNIFVNQNLGAAGSWVEYTVPQPRAYSRALMLFNEDDNLLAIMGAGFLPPSSVNQVSVSVVDLTEVGL
ncbi:family 93 glycoside hydrolase [Thelonectria olida]|uniref:Family 93 glycoside hydrolase n=1 Tax=Thelonectria olida TaxID=1576542 RepID=A0A9P9ALT5_9HYPO|nr:family 93 glycoside hydrolase [Thelonectria olida]